MGGISSWGHHQHLFDFKLSFFDNPLPSSWEDQQCPLTEEQLDLKVRVTDHMKEHESGIRVWLRALNCGNERTCHGFLKTTTQQYPS